MSPDPSRPLLAVIGATGTGKTAAAIALARRLGGTVINCDSRQFYRGLAVVTAQPSPEELAQAPHLLYGCFDVSEKIDAGRFVRLAEEAMDAVWSKGGVPILCGGTGLYLRCLLEGLAEIPQVPDDLCRQVRAELAAGGPRALHAKLAVLDAPTAARLHPNDSQRICRAVEVFFGTGKPLSAWLAEHEAMGPRHAALALGVEVSEEDVEPRLSRRIEAMLEAGALDEVRAVLDAGADPGDAGLSSIGAAELTAHLRGACDLDEARALWLRNTKAYAKRQRTWFRGHPPAAWFMPGQEDELIDFAGAGLAGRPS